MSQNQYDPTAPRSDVYTRLREAIDRMPIGFPPARSGVEISLLRRLFTPLQASIALHLGMLPEPVARIHRRAGRDIPISMRSLEEHLYEMFRKGAISMDASGGPGKRRYSLSQLAIGMFEFQVDRISADFARDFEAYIENDFHDAFFHSDTPQMRTIPVARAIESRLNVAPYNDVRKIVAGAGEPVVVQNCVCRQSNDVLGKPCSHSEIRETCFVFGESGRTVLERGSGRRIEKQEALRLLDRAEEAGFILQPQNSRSPEFICCCCGDCCHVLRALKKLPRPAEHFHSPCVVVVDIEGCRGCGKCVKRCGMEAIRMDGKLAVIDAGRCLGCGACLSVCPHSALELIVKKKLKPVPFTQTTLYVRILRERFGVSGLLRLAARLASGRKP
ncbi:MAG TPA: 4Fe-4S binding protein [Spirochaetota bacterium]|nr:4Fe-4S binding protein [Spirochaetota bacterium]